MKLDEPTNTTQPHIGPPALVGTGCCGKPWGCTNPTPECKYPNAMHKRYARGEITFEQLQAAAR